ncbi:MAG: hypothetical protein GY943_01460 [Chloroflexi bacterium]|nr:hypothetical protein [Chloroflexota bacterium]
MLLRYGISGYWSQDKAQPPSIDFDKFKDICHAVIRQYGGKVLETRDVYEIGTGNYHMTFFKQKHDLNQAIILYLNIHYPFLAVRIAPIDKNSEKILQSSEGWQQVNQVIKSAEIIFRFGMIYRFLEPVELNVPLHFTNANKNKEAQLVNLHELSKTEVKMIYKWQKLSSVPLTIGDVIFNWWD